jgi:hypothetical protein
MVKKHLRNFGAIHRFPGMEADALPKDKQVTHLLRRTLPGASFSELCDFQDKALTDILQQLFNAPFELTYPLKDYSSINERSPDSKVSIGEPWKDDHNYDHFINLKRKKALTKWLTGLLYSQTKSLRPRMTIFWLNYFPIQFQKINVAARAYDYLATIMNYSLENFRDLFLAQITGLPLLEYHMKIKPPRENLHRFHAHTILSRYLFGNDYASYISKDRIKRFTRLLREWSALNDTLALSAAKRNSGVPGEEETYGGMQSGDKPAVREFLQELNSFTGRLLHHERVADVLAERVFQYFVHPDVQADANKGMIHRLAEDILHYDYDIKKILSSVLLDEQFYSNRYYGSMIKSPVELLFGMFKDTGITDTTHANTLHNYSLWEWIHNQAELLGQSLGSITAWPVTNGYAQSGMLLDRMNMQTGLLFDYFSKSNFTNEQMTSFGHFLQTRFAKPDETWEGLLQKLQAKDEKAVVEVSGLMEDLVRHYIETPAYHYH